MTFSGTFFQFCLHIWDSFTCYTIFLNRNTALCLFLFREGGRIDHGHHASQAAVALSETVMFDKAVQVAKEITNDDDTLLVVTADHSHAFMMAGYPSRGNDILGLLKRFNSLVLIFRTFTCFNTR